MGAGVQDWNFAGMGLLEGLTLIAARAAATILAVPRPELAAREKPDASPVTAADNASEAVILDGLGRLMPGIPVISEETTAGRPTGPLRGRWLIVDPLDGTREFLAQLDEYVVNIALVEDGVPIAGVVAAPARNQLWRGDAGRGAERLVLAGEKTSNPVPVRTRRCPQTHPRVLVSRSHLDRATDAYVDRLIQPEKIACGSALKFCLLAEGAADLYPRLGPTAEWDVAAGHAVLAAAGGAVRWPDGEPLRYGAVDFRIPGFVAIGDPGAR
jgi:3'(2'), 5'-bisphosphate nucleotidase